MRGVDQALGMLMKPEDCWAGWGGVAADAFEDAKAIVEPGVEDRDNCFGCGFELVIDPDKLCGSRHETFRVALRDCGGQAGEQNKCST